VLKHRKSLAFVLEHRKSLASVLEYWKFLAVCLSNCNQILILVNSPWKFKGDRTTFGLWKEHV